MRASHGGSDKAVTPSAASAGGLTSLGAIRYEKQLVAEFLGDAAAAAPADAGTYRVSNAAAGVVFTIGKPTRSAAKR